MPTLDDAPIVGRLTADTVAPDDLVQIYGLGAPRGSRARTLTVAELAVMVDNFELPARFVILDPAGDNNAIKITSTDADILAAEILIDDDVDRTGLTVTSGPLLSIASGDKRVMRVTADFGDGVETVDLPYFEQADGKVSHYLDLGSADYRTRWDMGVDLWVIEKDGSNRFTSLEDVATPDLVTTWTPQATATGTPTVTAHPATAAQTIAAINAEEIEGVTASNAPGDDGSGFIGNVGSTPFIRPVTP
jgi:hypothetical protein